MKCAKCDQSYSREYDACPECAQAELEQRARVRVTRGAALIVCSFAVVLSAAGFFIGPIGGTVWIAAWSSVASLALLVFLLSPLSMLSASLTAVEAEDDDEPAVEVYHAPSEPVDAGDAFTS